MRKQGYRIGPGAASLLLIVVVLCLTVMGILSLMSARADFKLSERNSQMVSAYYAADEKAQLALAELDAVLLRAEAHAIEQGFEFAADMAVEDGFEDMAEDGFEEVFDEEFEEETEVRFDAWDRDNPFLAYLAEHLPEGMVIGRDGRTVVFRADAGDWRTLNMTVEILNPAEGGRRYAMRSMELLDEMPWETRIYEEMM